MKRLLILGVVLSGIWLLWSGHFEGLLLGLGGASILFVVLLSNHLKLVDEESVPTGLHYPTLAAYLPWLALEIVKANLDVARRIIRPGPLDISPRMIRVPASQRTELGRVIYANSITLTPGTISVDLKGGEILVHALHAEAAQGVESGDMDRRCTALEAKGR